MKSGSSTRILRNQSKQRVNYISNYEDRDLASSESFQDYKVNRYKSYHTFNKNLQN
jgi:hypothetical protein